MPTFAIIGFGVAILMALTAMIYQYLDLVPNYGNSTGGAMLTNHLWLVASLGCGVGSFAFVPWLYSVLVGVGIYGVSWLVRWLIEQVSKGVE